MNRLRDERGLIGFGTLRTLIVVALIGLGGIETAAVLFARLQVQDVAETAAAEAARAYRDRSNVELARQAAEVAVLDKDRNAELTTLEVTSERRVRVVVEKRASTLLIHRIEALRGFSRAVGRATADPPTV